MLFNLESITLVEMFSLDVLLYP